MEVFRREFLADVSHELKTPIFAAQGFLHTLLDGAMDDENVRDKFLLKAVKSLDGLNTMIQDLLTLSKMEAGFIKMDYDIFDITLLTRDVFEQLEEQAAKRKITLLFDKPYQEVMVYADAKRIRQVMINLLENAIKYGSKNGNVEVGFSPNDHQLLDITVKDDGPGISVEHLDRIFERFYRIEKSRSKDKGGSGLGLAIVKHILTAHETEINVNSKVKKGTAFTFQLQTTPMENEEVNKVMSSETLETATTVG
jgi:two-component system phosphate regulon sensor histidine kinase PhoR